MQVIVYTTFWLPGR